ncbi:MAG: hypothetical protein QXJ27_07660, partial [Thermoplasmata archaeon]
FIAIPFFLYRLTHSGSSVILLKAVISKGLIKLSGRAWKIAYWQDEFTPEVSKSHCAYYAIFGKLERSQPALAKGL